MRTAGTVLAVAAMIALTAFSVAAFPYYGQRTGEPGPIVYCTIGLWVLFAVALLALRGVPPRAVGTLVVLGSIGIGAAAMAGPPNTSTDSARYAWDGIVQSSGISPYDHVPADPELARLRPEWLFPAPLDGECVGARIMTFREPGTGDVLCSAINRATVPTIYPPLAELLFAGVRLLVGPEAEYWPLQLVGLLVSVAVTVILLRALARRGRDPRWAALWAWCPLVATEAVTNSHIDVVGALLALVAVLAASRGRPWLAGLALGGAISAKLIPVIAAPPLLRRDGLRVIAASVVVFAVLYVPYVIASGVGVLGYLPGYLSEEGYESGDRFALASLLVPGLGATALVVAVVAITAALVWWKTDPRDPWVGEVVLIGVVLIAVSPRYPWYALLLVPMIAMSGRWEWLGIAVALTARALIPSLAVSRIALLVAVLVIVVVAMKRSGPGAFSRARSRVRHPVTWIRERPEPVR
jgi:hypothetical protein